jgi:hypothetical protein
MSRKLPTSIKCFVAVSRYGISPYGSSFQARGVRQNISKTYPGGWQEAFAKGWRVRSAKIVLSPAPKRPK